MGNPYFWSSLVSNASKGIRENAKTLQALNEARVKEKRAAELHDVTIKQKKMDIQKAEIEGRYTKEQLAQWDKGLSDIDKAEKAKRQVKLNTLDAFENKSKGELAYNKQQLEKAKIAFQISSQTPDLSSGLGLPNDTPIDAMRQSGMFQGGKDEPQEYLKKRTIKHPITGETRVYESTQGKDIGSVEGLSSQQQLQARSLARKIAGVRGADKVLPSIYAEQKTGKSIDQIEDELRFSGQSEGFTGNIRNAVQSIMINADQGKTQRAMDYIDDLSSEGNIEEAKGQIKRLARKQAGTAEEAQINGKERTVELMDEIQSDLDTLESNGINTNIFSGTLEEVNSKIGRVKDPAMRQVATKIAIAVQNYRRSMSGVAFSVPESEEYKKIFPSISKTAEFNKSNIDALKEVMSGDLDKFYSLSMGKEAYKNMFGETMPEFNTKEEVEAANLKSGQRFIYKGEQYEKE